jgi:hypothetical protein
MRHVSSVTGGCSPPVPAGKEPEGTLAGSEAPDDNQPHLSENHAAEQTLPQ